MRRWRGLPCCCPMLGGHDIQSRFGPEGLDQALAARGVFDDDGVRAPVVGEIAHDAHQAGQIDARAPLMAKIEGVMGLAPDLAHRVVAAGGGLECRSRSLSASETTFHIPSLYNSHPASAR